MLWSNSVVSTVSSDTEPTIIINFDTAKYIFNAGENTTRAFRQQKQSWRGAKGVFLTGVGTQRGSGLPGLLMSLADSGVQAVNLVGPPGTKHFLAHMRTYLYRPNLYVGPIEADPYGKHGGLQPEPLYTDENLRIYGIPLSATLNDASDASEAGSKRKRAPSPDVSHKRGKHSTQEDTVKLSLVERSQQPDFNPADLTGDEAQAWRTLIIKGMFMQKAPAPKSRLKGKRAGEDLAIVPAPDEDAETSPAPAKGRAVSQFQSPLPKYDASKATLCYVCVGPRIRGKFDNERATQLQIPDGRCRADLIRGNAITFMVDDGEGGKIERTVKPEDVIGASSSPKVVMVFDVPTRDHIPSLVSTFETSSFYKTFLGSEHVDEHAVFAIYHLCGEGVLEDERYKVLINKFAPEVHHLVASREHSPDPVTFTTAAYYQTRMNQLDPKMFPTLKFNLEPRKQLGDITGLPENTIAMCANLSFSIKPVSPPMVVPAGTDFSQVVHSSEAQTLPDAVQAAFQTAKERADEALKGRQSRPGDDVIVTPLGTSSAVPSTWRNVSSTLIQIPKHGNILLDAGEGTWGQLIRLFGDDPARKSGVWAVLRDLKCIFLSHGHGDHHIGTAKILAMRQLMGPTQPLYVVGTRPILMLLREYNEIEDLGLDSSGDTGVETILSDSIRWDGRDKGYGMQMVMPWQDPTLNTLSKSAMCNALGLTDFATVEVMHAMRAYGCVIKHDDKWSITFSGDTRPTNNLVYAGRNSTLLIHEATMGDDQGELARQKAHSTFGEAVNIGRRMRAENTLLTHFSARYPRLPPPEQNPGAPRSPGGTSAPVLALAVDHTCVRLGDFAKLRAYLPALEQNFQDVVAQDSAEAEEDEVDHSKVSW